MLFVFYFYYPLSFDCQHDYRGFDAKGSIMQSLERNPEWNLSAWWRRGVDWAAMDMLNVKMIGLSRLSVLYGGVSWMNLIIRRVHLRKAGWDCAK